MSQPTYREQFFDLDESAYLEQPFDPDQEVEIYQQAMASQENLANSFNQYDAWQENYSDEIARPVHWAIAWSDLMMTMFILFLSLYIYQGANQEFLGPKSQEILGGDTTDALDINNDTGPFHDRQKLPFITAGEIPKVINVPSFNLQVTDKSSDSLNTNRDTSSAVASTGLPVDSRVTPLIVEDDIFENVDDLQKNYADIPQNEMQADSPKAVNDKPPAKTISELEEVNDRNLAILLNGEDFLTEEVDGSQQNTGAIAGEMPINEIYALSKKQVNSSGLNHFASVSLVADKTVRIILTGDLLFPLGSANLNRSAKESIQDLIGIIKNTPYMINVVGHTDNVPMTSGKYASNWELSVARASNVARFLIEKIGMNPNQFVVSGYSSYRPVKENSSSQNRAANRRVEIIISKKLPKPTNEIDTL